MRAAYHSEYRPGAADTSELDPCIAAETRLKKSAFSTRKKRTFCLIGVLALILFIFVLLLVIFLSASPGKPSNIHTVGDFEYEDMESATLVRDPPPPPPPATTTETTVASTDESPTTTPIRRQSTPRPMPIAMKEIVVEKDEQAGQIHRVEVQQLQPQSTTKTTTTSAPMTTTPATTTPRTRPTMRTRPSSVFPTAQLRADGEGTPLERKTETVRESCTAHATAALGSGVYRIAPEEGDLTPFDAYCRMDEDDMVGGSEDVFRAGGAWTYVQSLSSEAYFYNRTFNEYERGFGRVDGSHWLGLEAMHRLAPGGSGQRPATLRIELYGDHCSDANQCSGRPDGFWWGEWEFGLASVDDLYRLHISPARHGNLTVHTKKDVFYEMNNGRQFTTADRDNDNDEFVNCGQTRNYGGWWHKDCTLVALNGLYGDDRSKLRYQVWYRATMAGDPLKSSYHIHPKRSIMMMRPRI